MKLSNLLDLYKGCVASITGAGGKTSLMFTLAEELRKNSRVLVTTTTKIFVPSEKQYDFISMLEDKEYTFSQNSSKGVYVLGNSISAEGKIMAVTPEFLDSESKHFDFTLIEADGSKRKPLKGWRENEPVICKSTEKTIGVLDIKSLGITINEERIHRLPIFFKLTGGEVGQEVTINHLASLILHPEGLFKGSIGERILYVNKVESDMDKHNTRLLVKAITERNNGYIDRIISGSLKEKNFQVEA